MTLISSHRQILCYFLLAILACSICISSAGNRNKNILFGPMAGKRSSPNEDLNDFMGFFMDNEEKQVTRSEEPKVDRTCWLDAAYERLSPQMKDIVIKIVSLETGKRS